MKTWIRWTHYDCEVDISLFATEEEGYLDLKGWLTECDEDCGHNPEMTDCAEIGSALNWHYDDELNWGVYEVEVPVAYTTREDIEKFGEAIALINKGLAPTDERMAAERADQLLAQFRAFKEES